MLRLTSQGSIGVFARPANIYRLLRNQVGRRYIVVPIDKIPVHELAAHEALRRVPAYS
jgi:hypothetical protein